MTPARSDRSERFSALLYPGRGHTSSNQAMSRGIDLTDSDKALGIAAPFVLQGWTPMYFVVIALLLTLVANSALSEAVKPSAAKQTRTQLSIGYSLLYQEADGIPKLKWILMFKDKPEEMARVANDLLHFYQQLADTMLRLSKEYPAMRIDAPAMSEIEADERKAIGEDMAKDFAPVVGKTGVDFEREALLTFYDSLNEQRHLTGVMIKLEPNPGLHKFLETTKAQLDQHFGEVDALLRRRYFTH